MAAKVLLKSAMLQTNPELSSNTKRLPQRYPLSRRFPDTYLTVFTRTKSYYQTTVVYHKIQFNDHFARPVRFHLWLLSGPWSRLASLVCTGSHYGVYTMMSIGCLVLLNKLPLDAGLTQPRGQQYQHSMICASAYRFRVDNQVWITCSAVSGSAAPLTYGHASGARNGNGGWLASPSGAIRLARTVQESVYLNQAECFYSPKSSQNIIPSSRLEPRVFFFGLPGHFLSCVCTVSLRDPSVTTLWTYHELMISPPSLTVVEIEQGSSVNWGSVLIWRLLSWAGILRWIQRRQVVFGYIRRPIWTLLKQSFWASAGDSVPHNLLILCYLWYW